MKIINAYGCPYEDNTDEILELDVRLDKGEIVSLGDTIAIEMMDDTVIYREVKLIDPKYAGDFAPISSRMAEEVRSMGSRTSRKPKKAAMGECTCRLVVLKASCRDVKTDYNVAAKEMVEEWKQRVCITPYKEIDSGDESILDHVKPGYAVPEKVITYLKMGEAYYMCPGIYEHPFVPGKQLPGPYTYSDGYYYWDRDTWKYVVKYRLTLPQEFVDHVMSEDGTAFIEKRLQEEDNWGSVIKHWKRNSNALCLLPENGGDVELKEF